MRLARWDLGIAVGCLIGIFGGLAMHDIGYAIAAVSFLTLSLTILGRFRRV